VKTSFYLGILLPAFLFSTRQEYRRLVANHHFHIVLALCGYALVRSAEPSVALGVLKALGCFLALLLGAMKLPIPRLPTVKQAALLFIVALLIYVFANAVHQGMTQQWLPGMRLAPLFGNLNSVIFCADLMVSALVVYSWCCLRMHDYRSLLIANTVVIVSALWLLQSRSALPVWLGSMAVMLACTVSAKERRRVLLYISITLIAIVALTGGALPALLERGDSYRFEIWTNYLASMRDCGTLLGCGWGLAHSFTTQGGIPIMHVHSMYVQHLFWGGIVGLVLLLLTLLPPMIAGVRRAHFAAWALLSGCIALAFDGNDFIAQPNQRWFLAVVPLAFLIAGLAGKTSNSIASGEHP